MKTFVTAISGRGGSGPSDAAFQALANMVDTLRREVERQLSPKALEEAVSKALAPVIEQYQQRTKQSCVNVRVNSHGQSALGQYRLPAADNDDDFNGGASA